MLKKILFIFLLIYSVVSYGQNIKGYVYDEVTKEPVELASVYFNNTTLGTTTDSKGYFEITNPEVDTELIISFIGYQDKIITKIEKEDSFRIYLKEAASQLETVVITNDDPLSRREKLKMFKRAFLGTLDASKCKIKNEKDLRLRYNGNNKTLKVKSKRPIVIVNKYLGYKLEFSLSQFIAEYRWFKVFEKRELTSRKVVYYGNTKFTELSKKKKYKKAREGVYLGSKLHFMRSLYLNKLKENTFGFVKNGVITKPEKCITKIMNHKLVTVKTKTDTLDIAYYPEMNVILQSRMIVESKEFKIDQFGNSTSDPIIMFSGMMGGQKTAQMLPLDYSITEK